MCSLVVLRRCFVITLAAVCITVVQPTVATCQTLPKAKPSDLGIPDEKFKLVSDYVDNLVKRGEVPGVVAIVAYKGKVILRKAVGSAVMEPVERQMTTDTIFRMASMTKPVTSVAVMMLVEDGKLKLDDPVSKHVPEMAKLMVVTENGERPAKREPTIHDLLTHTSGLVYDNGETIGLRYTKARIESGVNQSSVLLKENIRKLGEIPILFDPGTRFHYGMSTDVLGLVVQRASEARLDKFFEQRIFKPLGMNDTFFRVPKKKQHRLAATFLGNGNGYRQLRNSEMIRHSMFRVRMQADHATSKAHRYLSGGGGLCSTADDYLKFCQMLVSGGQLGETRLLRPSTVRQMTTNQIGDLYAGQLGNDKFRFGYGFAVFPDVNGMHSENSWGGIWGTKFRISRGDRWICILLTQRVADATAQTREIDFNRLVREAIPAK